MILIINGILLIVTLGLTKRASSPYLAALVIGILKTVVYILFSNSMIVAVSVGMVFGLLVTIIVYFLRRIDKARAAVNEPVPSYRLSNSEKIEFQWEYLPLTITLLIFLGGEFFLQ